MRPRSPRRRCSVTYRCMEHVPHCRRLCWPFDLLGLTSIRVLQPTEDGLLGNVAVVGASHREQRADLPPSPGHTPPYALKHTPRSAMLSGASCDVDWFGCWQECLALRPAPADLWREIPHLSATGATSETWRSSSGILGLRCLIDREFGKAHADIGVDVVGRLGERCPPLEHTALEWGRALQQNTANLGD